MPVAALSDALHQITEAVTDLVGDYGLYAVFVLMLIDAVLPAASELVMVYAGALAAGALAGQSVTLAKAHSMRLMTTRRLHPGTHRITLQVNGKPQGSLEFELINDSLIGLESGHG